MGRESKRMVLVAIWVTKRQYKFIKWMIEEGFFINTSEAVRYALNRLIEDVLREKELFDKFVRVG